ncbi:hypothetical protein SDC9_153475 [bioreactor metagenome]|uniref:Uncharacterized protein n=1 Tax=bioreactor metagenome TaxID=1076179 RepID=A0A645EYG7_9ZZZZ
MPDQTPYPVGITQRRAQNAPAHVTHHRRRGIENAVTLVARNDIFRNPAQHFRSNRHFRHLGQRFTLKEWKAAEIRRRRRHVRTGSGGTPQAPEKLIAEGPPARLGF